MNLKVQVSSFQYFVHKNKEDEFILLI